MRRRRSPWETKTEATTTVRLRRIEEKNHDAVPGARHPCRRHHGVIGVGPAHNGFHLEPRCRVCRNDLVRKKVNDLLATGASYAMVLRALAEDNAELDKCDRVTIDSVRNHSGRHFPVQNVAKATYREILERRAKANGVDFVEGVATAITPIAFFETVMVKSYETLVDSDTKVDVNTGIVAAGRLQSLIDSRDYDHELLVMKVQMGQICERSSPRAAGDVGDDRREAGGAGAALGGARRRGRTPSMTLTMTPTTRPSSSTTDDEF